MFLVERAAAIDDAVAKALGWDANELTGLRMLLHEEPCVRGLGREQYA